MTVVRFRLALGALCLLVIGIGMGTAGEKAKPLVLPPALTKEFPEGPDDLRAIEKHVQVVLDKVMPSVVGVRIGQAQGSGVIINKEGVVLTAGHVSGQPERDAQIILPDGKKLKAKTLGRNNGIDSGMLKIVDDGPFPFVELGKSAEVKKGHWVIAIGHPGGFRTNRTPVVRVGRVLIANKLVIRTDCTLVGGDSGGPLFDMNGTVIGIHSRIGGIITDNFHVPADTYRDTWDRLAKGESWGGVLGAQPVIQSPGGKVVLDVEGKISSKDPLDAKQQECYHKVHSFKMSPGSIYTIDLINHKGNVRKYDPFLRVEDSSRKQIAEDDDSAGNLNARLVFRPTKEDEYRLIVTSCDPGQVGAYKLTVRQADLKEALVAGKADVLKALGLPKPAVPILLDKLSQAGVNLYASATLFDAKGNLTPGKELAFQWLQGTKALKTDEKGMARLELKKENVKNLFATVPEGYKAAFELTDSDGNYFPFTPGKDFAKEKVKSAGGKLVFKLEGQVAENDPYDKVRKECRHKVVTFKMLPGSKYTIDLESADFDAYLRLEDSTGKPLAEDDDGAGKLNSRIVFQTTKDDVFRLIITTCDPDQTGAFRLTIHQAEAKDDEKKDESKGTAEVK